MHTTFPLISAPNAYLILKLGPNTGKYGPEETLYLDTFSRSEGAGLIGGSFLFQNLIVSFFQIPIHN